MNRRQLLGMIGLGAPIVAVGVGAPVAATVLMVKSKEQKDIESQLEGNVSLVHFQQIYGEEIPHTHSNIISGISGKNYKLDTVKKVTVSLNVGPDGHLYAKTNGQWSKIA